MSDTSNHRRSSRKGKARASSSSQSPDPAQDSRSDSESLPPPSEPVSGKKVKGQAKKSSASGSVERRTPSATSRDGKTTKDVETPRTDGGDMESSDVNEFGGEDVTAVSSSPPHPVPPPTAMTKSGGRTAAVRSAVSSVTAKRTPTNNVTAAAAAVAKATDDDATDVRLLHRNLCLNRFFWIRNRSHISTVLLFVGYGFYWVCRASAVDCRLKSQFLFSLSYPGA